MDAQHFASHSVRFGSLIRNVGVIVEAKHLWRIFFWELVDVVSVRLCITECRCLVLLGLGVEVVIGQVVCAVILLESGEQATQVLVVSYTTTIVDDTGDVHKGIPRDLLLVFKEDLQHRERGVQIRVIEGICNIPAERSELTSLLDDSVEEGHTEDHLSVDGLFLAVVEPGVRDFSVASLQVGFDTSGRLRGQLNTVLEDRDREEFNGCRSQEQSEVGVHFRVIWQL